MFTGMQASISLFYCLLMLLAERCTSVYAGIPGGGCHLCGDDSHHAVYAGPQKVWLELDPCLYVWSYDRFNRCSCHRVNHENK